MTILLADIGAVAVPVSSLVDITASGSTPTVPPKEPVATRGESRRARRKRTHRRRWWSLVVVVSVVILAAAGLEAARRIDTPLAKPTVSSRVPASLAAAGVGPSVPWPVKGQGAIFIPSLGYAQQSGPEWPVPIASLTKLTSAIVVLHDRPVAANTDGPMITITAADVAEYDNDVHKDESTIPVQVGEQLSERQMLEALLTRSANNIAYSLAVWDAGSAAAFVARMNAMAASLGATSSHYVDVSGFDQQSVSTAADCLRITAAGMRDPTFAAIVALPSVTLPLVGTVPNLVTEVGSDNVVGVKSGYTSHAGGCMVLAGDRVLQGRTVQVLVAVLGQPTPAPVPPTTTTTPPKVTVPGTPTTTTTTVPPDQWNVPDPFRFTRPVAENLLGTTEASVVPVTVSTAGKVVALVTSTWGRTHHQVPVITRVGAFVLAWPGQQVASAATLRPVGPGDAIGSQVGTATYSLGTQVESVPLQLTATVPEPSWWWRLIHAS
jgi:D-alanyl-D-alanine carboxypeptidase (penicillin-binding protein 5/6)